MSADDEDLLGFMVFSDGRSREEPAPLDGGGLLGCFVFFPSDSLERSIPLDDEVLTGLAAFSKGARETCRLPFGGEDFSRRVSCLETAILTDLGPDGPTEDRPAADDLTADAPAIAGGGGDVRAAAGTDDDGPADEKGAAAQGTSPAAHKSAVDRDVDKGISDKKFWNSSSVNGGNSEDEFIPEIDKVSAASTCSTNECSGAVICDINCSNSVSVNEGGAEGGDPGGRFPG